ncbi:unnamed protein product [Brassica oleracea]
MATATVAISSISSRPLVALHRSRAAAVSYSSSRQFLRHRSISSPRLLFRNVRRVQATILQDDEEKVVVEESFKAETFPGKGPLLEEESDTSSSALEASVIKLEQGVNVFLTDSVIKILDTLYRDRTYPRFFVLETIARVPYFAFMSVLHMYETFGWWRRADYLKVHFAESWNEMHHLLIMEELGGNSWWFDRFLGQIVATFYYFMTVFLYIVSPRMAYHFSECVESHAFETYDKFLKTNGEELKKSPAPDIAVKYYTGSDMYLFDEFQTSRAPNTRRPVIENLYDVFVNIRDDEAEHCKTMRACQTLGSLRSPHSVLEDEECDEESGCVIPEEAHCEGIMSVADGTRRKRTLRERLRFKFTACCGPTLNNTTTSATLHSPTSREDEIEEQSEIQFVTRSDTGSGSGMNLATALEAERYNRGEPAVDMTPRRVSLMRLLDETAERVDDDGRETEISTASLGTLTGNDSVCCVCMGRKKGAAFIPCGHTFCRVCSRELWLNRGSCPLCNRPIIEILDIF